MDDDKLLRLDKTINLRWYEESESYRHHAHRNVKCELAEKIVELLDDGEYHTLKMEQELREQYAPYPGYGILTTWLDCLAVRQERVTMAYMSEPFTLSSYAYPDKTPWWKRAWRHLKSLADEVEYDGGYGDVDSPHLR